MLLRKKLFLVIFAFFLLFQPTVMSMDPQKSHHHRDAIISEYNVDVGEVDFSDPPFYLIETEDNKIIYVLGAMHPLPVIPFIINN